MILVNATMKHNLQFIEVLGDYHRGLELVVVGFCMVFLDSMKWLEPVEIWVCQT